MSQAVRIELKNSANKDMLAAFLAELDIIGIEEQSDILIVYPSSLTVSNNILNLCNRKFSNEILNIEIREITEHNWNALWESGFQPISIDNFCHIRADFHPADTSGCKYEIIITPKMSFGTGHHETTRMMMENMSAIDFQSKKVFDFGCGTGILAILADKMGAEKIIGMESDIVAVENAIENITRNHASTVEIIHSDKLDNIHGSFDIFMANITRNVILEHANSILKHIEDRGILITSGYLKKDGTRIRKIMESLGLKTIKSDDKAEWMSHVFQKTMSS